jgi:hypothetical protein
MHRIQFNLIAEIIANIITAEELGGSARDSKKMIVKQLAMTNANFDGERFWRAVEAKALENRAITKE